MRLQYLPYLWPLLAASGLTAALALTAIRHRIVRGAPAFAVSMLLMTVWFFASYSLSSGTNLRASLAWLNIAYFAISLIPVAWLVMTLQLAGGERWLSRGLVLPLLVVPAATNLFLWLAPDLMRQNVVLDAAGPFPVLHMTYGPWFWVHTAYSYGLNFTSLFWQGRALRRKTDLGRRQISALFVALLIVTAGNLVSIFRIIHIGIDLTPAAIIAGSLIIAWCLFRYRLFDVVPIARATVVENMRGAVVVLDERHRVVDLNPVAAELLQCPPAQAVGRPCGEIMADWPELARDCRDLRLERGEYTREGQEKRYYDAYFSNLRNRRGRPIGRLIVVYDVSETRRAQEELAVKQRALFVLAERERLARELHDSLGQVLGYLHLQAQAVRDLLAQGRAAAAAEPLAGMIAAAREAQTDIREFIHEVRTAFRFERGFKTALQQYLARLQGEYGLDVVLTDEADLDGAGLDLATQVQLFRIIQEALTNVRKHARARSVRISFAAAGAGLAVVVEDDGAGFDPGHLDAAGKLSFGLGVMRERAAEICASFSIESAPGRGTRVEVKIPPKPAGEEPAESTNQAARGLRILLADDHPLFREGLRSLLQARGYEVIGEAGDGMEALAKTRALLPDAVLMDIQMPGCDGLAATRLIKAEMPEVKIVMLTMSEEDEQLFESIRCGASGYLLKSLSADELCTLLDGLVKGEAPLSPGLAAKVLHELARLKEDAAAAASADRCRPAADLTPRQLEVLTLVAQGMTYKEIGARLFLTERTIKYHMGEILAQLHLGNRREVAAYARKMGIVPDTALD